MKEKAYAKINLALDVCGVLDNGYHELKSVMLPINFYDVLEINIASEDNYYCNWSYITYNEHNSIYKMISLLKERYSINDHYYVKLLKSVPIQAGLGGGTADAAAALRIFEKLYDLKLDKQEIRDICVKVGADVLFNYYNMPALVKGIGDIIEPIDVKNRYHVLLIKPRSGISTVKAYEALNIDTCDHPDIERLLSALRDGDSIEGLLGNSLQGVALQLNSEISDVLRVLHDAGARNVLMSGSGSTVFCISEDRNEIIGLYDKIKHLNYYIRFSKILHK